MNILSFKKIHFSLVLVFFLFTSCEDECLTMINEVYVSIPDNNFETILIEQGIDSDGIVNQKILLDDAENVTRLDLNFFDNPYIIRDLTGIEDFTNLTFLSAGGQEIEEIDLRFNAKLDSLLLFGNHLTSIDVSHNSNLSFLDVQANELRSISGLSSLKNLKNLNLSFNYLEDISIQNESIKVLFLTHNLLRTIDINGAFNLKSVLLISNQLTSIDLSTNELLETLVISDNRITNINLERNSYLTHFYMSSNALTSLDVSNNQQLVDLRVDRNPDLSCIKVLSGQEIPSVSLSDHQELNTNCL